MTILGVLEKLRSVTKGEKAALQVVDSLMQAVKALEGQVNINEDVEDDAAWSRVQADLQHFTYENLLEARRNQGLPIGKDVEKELAEVAQAAQELASMLGSIRNPV